MPPRSPLALTARFPELSSSDGEAMSEADDGGAGLLGRTPSFADNDRLKGALKPFVMRADFIKKYSQKHLEVEKIMDHKEMLQGMKKLDNRMSFNLKDLQKCLFDIYEERTAAGEDIGLLSTDVTIKNNWQAAVAKRLKAMCVHINKALNASPRPRWVTLLFDEDSGPGADGGQNVDPQPLASAAATLLEDSGSAADGGQYVIEPQPLADGRQLDSSVEPDVEVVNVVAAPNGQPDFVTGFQQGPGEPRAWRATMTNKRKIFTSEFQFERDTDRVWATWEDGFMAEINQIRKNELQALLQRGEDRDAKEKQRAANGVLFEAKGQTGKNITITRKHSEKDGVIMLIHEESDAVKNPLGQQLFQVIIGKGVESSEEDKTVGKIKGLVQEYAKGNISDLKAEKDRIFPRAAAPQQKAAEPKGTKRAAARGSGPKAKAKSTALNALVASKKAQHMMSDSDDFSTESQDDEPPYIDLSKMPLGVSL